MRVIRKRSRFLFFALLSFLFGCPGLGSQQPLGADEDTIPENPTWEEHVLPIMNTYCNECHSVPAQQNAPLTFRLDSCEDLVVDGAKKWAIRIVIRTVESPALPMPPADYPQQPTETDKQILQNWVDNGAPCGTEGPGPSDAGMNNGGGGNNSMMNNGTMNNAPMSDAGMDTGMSDMMDAGMDAGVDLGPPAPTFSMVADYLRMDCAKAGCHGDGRGGLQFANNIGNAELHDLLLTGSGNSNNTFVVANQPMNSELYVRMVDAGDPMPPDTGLNAEAAQMVREWIEDGAPNN